MDGIEARDFFLWVHYHISPMKAPLPLLDEFRNSSELKKFLRPKNLHRIAREVGFIARSRKLTASAFLGICTFFPKPSSYPTLEAMCAELACSYRIHMRPESLWERFGPDAVAFMKEVLAQALKVEFGQRFGLEGLSDFAEIFVMDSTSIHLDEKCAAEFRGSGGVAGAAAAKVQFCIGLLGGSVQELDLHHGTRSDAGHRVRNVVYNALYLFDLGYFCAENFKAIIEGGGWFISRLRYDASLFHPDGRPITREGLDRMVAKLKPGKTLDMDVLVFQKARIPVRLVLTKLKPALGDQIRDKLIKQKGRKGERLSPGRLAFCHVNAFITNIPQEKMPADKLRAVYSLRWQVEIMFKCWKSGLGLDKVRNVGPWQFQCILYGGLLRMLLCQRIFWKAKTVCWKLKGVELSELKGMRYLQESIDKAREWMVTKKRKNASFLSEIWKKLTKSCVKHRKKADLSPFETIQFYA